MPSSLYQRLVITMSPFWQNMVVTFFGTLCAMGTALWLNRRQDDKAHKRLEKQREEQDRQQIQALIDRMHQMRALPKPPKELPSPPPQSPMSGVVAPNVDRERCIKSVLQLRRSAQDTMGSLVISSPHRAALMELISACNAFLDDVEWSPEGYAGLLSILSYHADAVTKKLLSTQPDLNSSSGAIQAGSGNPDAPERER